MEALTVVCLRYGLDYFRTRAALFRGEVKGELRGKRLYVDAADAERWKREQTQPVPAA